jgi:hypothetical protein
MISDSAPGPGARPLGAQDYRIFRWALALPLVGAFSSPLLAALLSAIPVPDRVHDVLGSMLSFVFLTLGLLALRTLREDARYRLFIDLALAGSLAAPVAAGLVGLIPGAAGLHVGELFTALAVLFFVLALRRLVMETNWAQDLRMRLRRSVTLVAALWVGPAGLLIPLSLSHLQDPPAFEKSWPYFLILALQGIPAIHLLRVLWALYRDAGLRNNVLVVRGRRSPPG